MTRPTAERLRAERAVLREAVRFVQHVRNITTWLFWEEPFFHAVDRLLALPKGRKTRRRA